MNSYSNAGGGEEWGGEREGEVDHWLPLEITREGTESLTNWQVKENI